MKSKYSFHSHRFLSAHKLKRLRKMALTTTFLPQKSSPLTTTKLTQSSQNSISFSSQKSRFPIFCPLLRCLDNLRVCQVLRLSTMNTKLRIRVMSTRFADGIRTLMCLRLFHTLQIRISCISWRQKLITCLSQDLRVF